MRSTSRRFGAFRLVGIAVVTAAATLGTSLTAPAATATGAVDTWLGSAACQWVNAQATASGTSIPFPGGPPVAADFDDPSPATLNVQVPDEYLDSVLPGETYFASGDAPFNVVALVWNNEGSIGTGFSIHTIGPNPSYPYPGPDPTGRAFVGIVFTAWADLGGFEIVDGDLVYVPPENLGPFSLDIGCTPGPAPDDTTDPVVTCDGPAPVFLLNDSSAEVTGSLVDETAPTAPQSVSASADTSSVGHKTVTVSGQDEAGNTGEAECDYSVVYGFTGFFSPVDNAPTLNVAKAGQAVPFKFRVTDANGAPVTTLTTATSLAVTGSCQSAADTDALETYATGSSGLQNLGNGYYQFNYKTLKSWAGSCRTLGIDLGDGVRHTANFSFR